MSVYYVIDGYNLIETHKDSFPGDLRTSRDHLIEIIHKRKPEGSGRNKITVVFDGQPGVSSPEEKEVDVIFTSGRSADWKIIKLVEGYNNPKQIIVVTDDRAIQRQISLSGAKFMSTVEFMKRLFPKKNNIRVENDKKLTSEDIEKINNEFLKKKGLM
jgi:predicted RNA-binding protein with PIN domain